MRSGNPALNDSTFNSFRGGAYESSNAMTITGTATKTMILLGLCIGTASMSWGMVAGQNMGAALPWMIGGLVGGLIFGLATRYVVVVMVGFVMVATFSSHRYWEFADAAARRTQDSSFYKNTAMLGGFFFLFSCGAGRLSVDRWLRGRS